MIVLTFLPEQVAWAVDYNLRGVLSGSGINAVSQAAVATDGSVPKEQLASNQVIAKSIKESLSQLVNKDVTDIKLSRDLIIHRTYPLSLNEEKLNELSAWMNDGQDLITCGSYALAGMFGLMGRRINADQIAHYALLIDILSDSLNIYTYNKAKKLESSLYALDKTAEFFGIDLKPIYFKVFDLNNKEISKAINKLIPFIAFVDDDHMVLVKGLSKEGLIIEDNGKENILNRAQTQAHLSGYGLVRAKIDLSGLEIEVLDDEIAKAIRGTKRQVFDTYDFNSYFPEQPKEEIGKSLLIVGGAFLLGGGFGSSSFGSFAAGAVASMTSSMIYSEISSAATIIAAKQWGFNETWSQL
ncbi:MAG TPA: cysteine peptidase family C39 domain-containing protein, partial [Candidatus Omnitrophota bacterium]|nr:cysteine peptidase family C39 domain-containing protein [Candidatus Omnitrophota bacterium]